ncbi:MAG TPA: hypothetical protein VGI81_05465 [Tepidisphaeraceae bacterium]|jgi:hypothetical protein
MIFLTERHKDWLRSAWVATLQEGPVFPRAFVRRWSRMGRVESTEIAESLQKEGLVSLLPGDEAILTDKGRQTATKLSAPLPFLPDFRLLQAL